MERWWWWGGQKSRGGADERLMDGGREGKHEGVSEMR